MVTRQNGSGHGSDDTVKAELVASGSGESKRRKSHSAGSVPHWWGGDRLHWKSMEGNGG